MCWAAVGSGDSGGDACWATGVGLLLGPLGGVAWLLVSATNGFWTSMGGNSDPVWGRRVRHERGQWKVGDNSLALTVGRQTL